MKNLRIFSSSNNNTNNNNKNQQNHCHHRYREKSILSLSSSLLLLVLSNLLLSIPDTTLSFQIWPLFSSFPKYNSKTIKKESTQSQQQQKETNINTETTIKIHPILLQDLQVDKFLIRERDHLLELNKNTNNNIIMKAWTCHGGSQKDLVDRLIQAGIIKSYPVQQVMYQVDRKNYIVSNNNIGGGTTGSNIPVQQAQDQLQSASTVVSVSAYQDTPQPIYNGQTISAPHMHAHALEEIYPYIIRRRNYILDNKNIKEQQNCIKILDVGCGSGYLTACFGRWFQPKDNINQSTISVEGTNNNSKKNDTTINYDYNSSILASELPTTSTSTTTSNIHGYVYGIDIHESLVSLTRSNIQKEDSDLLVQQKTIPTSTTNTNTNTIVPTIQLQVSNGWDGLIEYGPYDAIHVGAAAATFPIQLANQLSIGGVMIIPIGQQGSCQSLYKVERISNTTGSSDSDKKFFPDNFKYTELLGVRYVPLINGPTTTKEPSSSTPPPWNNNNNRLKP